MIRSVVFYEKEKHNLQKYSEYIASHLVGTVDLENADGPLKHLIIEPFDQVVLGLYEGANHNIKKLCRRYKTQLAAKKVFVFFLNQTRELEQTLIKLKKIVPNLSDACLIDNEEKLNKFIERLNNQWK